MFQQRLPGSICAYGVILLLVTGSCFYLNAQADYSASPLTYGDSAVGFSRHLATDSSRVYRRVQDYSEQLQFREMQISRWYPAREPGQVKMLVQDYLQVLKEEEEWENLPAEFVFDWFYYPRNAVTELNATYVTQAFRNASAAAGRFPVVFYAPSYHASSSENFMLCEYLASHGYLVLALPSRGRQTMQLTGGTAEDAGAQQRDLEYLFGYAASLNQADMARVYTIGFSFGGLSNVPFAMSNRFIDGVISLDGSIKYNLPAASALPGFDPARLQVPFVHFRQKPIPEIVMKADGIDAALAVNFAFMDSLTAAPAYEFGVPDLTHGQFASYGILFEPRDERQDRPAEQIHQGYANLCEAVLLTLRRMATYESENYWDGDAYEKEISTTGHHLYRRIPGQAAAAAGPNEFFDAVRAAGFDKIDSVYSAFIERDPAFSVPEGVLNTLGLQLGMGNDKAKGIAGTAVLDFAVKCYPESANLHDSLATVCVRQGLRDKAIYHYERSLALNPENEFGKKQLEMLRR